MRRWMRPWWTDPRVIAELPGAGSAIFVWRVGQMQYAAAMSLQMATPVPAQAIRERLAIHEELVHLTIEVSAD